MLISIVIATFNRCAMLGRQMEALRAMRGIDGGAVEVVYVDNNSTDGTFEELQRLAAGVPWARILRETRQGSSYARNRGAAEALGEYVWYFDDDSLPYAGALEAMLEALPRWRPEVATGPIHPRCDVRPPWWFEPQARQFAAYLAAMDYRRETSWIEGGYGWAPNLVIRRDVMAQTGGYDVALGVVGSGRGGGEEEELQRRIFRAGGRLLFVREAAVDHLVTDKQLSLRYFLRHRFARGGTSARLALMEGGQFPGLVPTAVRGAGHVLYSLPLFALRRTPAAMDHFSAAWGLLGQWHEQRLWRRAERQRPIKA